jgi:hypothetical protein
MRVRSASSDYRNTAMSAFKESGSKTNGTLRRVLFANMISNSDALDTGAVGRRKNETADFSRVSDRYFFRQFQNVDADMLALAQYVQTVSPLFW